MANDEEPKVWEARIKYYQSYIYDKQFLPGMIFEVKNDNLVPSHLARNRKNSSDKSNQSSQKPPPEELRIHPRMGKTPRVSSTQIPQSSHRHRSLLAHIHKSARPTRSRVSSNLCCQSTLQMMQKKVLMLKREGHPRRKRTSATRRRTRIL